MAWVNYGDINPEEGALLLDTDTLEFDGNGDFGGTAVTSDCDSVQGGADHVFLLRMGDLFLARKDFKVALQACGARLDGDTIRRPTGGGDEEVLQLGTPDGNIALALAAHAYHGIDIVDIESIVSIGYPTAYDQEQKFEGETTFYERGTSLWDIMRDHMEGMDYIAPTEDPDAVTVPKPIDPPGELDDSPSM
mgnify:CR=1 FL=1